MATSRHPIIRILQIFTLVLVVTSNFMLGQLSAKKFDPESIPVVTLPDTRDPAPTVRIDGVRSGKLEGEILGDARLLVGGNPVIPQESGNFAISAASVLVNRVPVIVPSGMQYVASRKGKYFYTVGSAKGASLSPENRVYFHDEATAKAAGFLPAS